MKVVAVSGYFDPLHVGHLEYLELAAGLGDKLVVIVNNDKQAKLKKGRSFMKEDDRVKIIEALQCVDEVFLAIDQGTSVCESLSLVYPDIFANGGDRSSDEAPEVKLCREMNIEVVDNLGEKIRSSSSFTGIK
jgi:cytidyltransferase-like protein